KSPKQKLITLQRLNIQILISVALNIQKYAHNQLQLNSIEPPSKKLQTQPHLRSRRRRRRVDRSRRYSQSFRSQRNDLSTQTRNSHYPYQYIYSDEEEGMDGDTDDTHENDSDEHDTYTNQYIITYDNYYDPEDCNSDTFSDTDYLKSKAWWLGMILMVLGECGNFLAY